MRVNNAGFFIHASETYVGSDGGVDPNSERNASTSHVERLCCYQTSNKYEGAEDNTKGGYQIGAESWNDDFIQR